MLTSKLEFQNYTLAAAVNGTLLIDKHLPASLPYPAERDRTIVTPVIAANLVGIVCSGRFDAVYYQNPQHATTPDYVEMKPLDPEFFVTASGVPAFTSSTDYPKDRLIFYSGALQGWHCCGEDSARIQARVAAGTLVRIGPLV